MEQENLDDYLDFLWVAVWCWQTNATWRKKQFLDNVTTHEASAQNVTLKNVRIEFIPPNCTSVQLIDMVWEALWKFVIGSFSLNKEPKWFSVESNLRTFCEFGLQKHSTAWITQTVDRCFKKAGFTKETQVIMTSPRHNDETIDEAESQ